tara:strand:+ start:523 stop:765 length:243 start_codon:yes stop_codon:yes gene_type:complete
MEKQLAIEFLHFVTQYGFTYVGHSNLTKPYTYSFINDGYDPSSRFIVPANKERLTSIELFEMFMENKEGLDKGFLFDNVL